jgi:ElaB/YqjD/DUF883 family membrane-anchored ribosome-binding protein
MKESPLQDSRSELATEFLRFADDAEALLAATAHQGGDEVAAIRTRVEHSMHAARQQLNGAQDAVIVQGRAAAHATDSYVHDNPWTAVGVAAGVGLLVGLIGARR